MEAESLTVSLRSAPASQRRRALHAHERNDPSFSKDHSSCARRRLSCTCPETASIQPGDAPYRFMKATAQSGIAFFCSRLFQVCTSIAITQCTLTQS